MTPLEIIIREKIAARGPMPVDEYMALCLYHPTYGYYITRDPLGSTGDFITSPEISQLFGEMLALWAIEKWQALGSPTRFTLLECGPGRGTLMHDLLRAAKALPAFLNAAYVILCETSPVLRLKQKQLLAQYNTVWIDDITTLPAQPTLLVANEFLDAFPIKRFVNDAEQCVILKDNALAFSREGSVRETSPAIENWMNTFCAHLKAHGGAGCFIDYAYEGNGHVDTLQAVKNHKPASLFEQPGECDLTAYVNYSPLIALAQKHGLKTESVVSQRHFLMRYGIELRLAQLLKKAIPEQIDPLKSGVARLLDSKTMGNQFKILEISQL